MKFRIRGRTSLARGEWARKRAYFFKRRLAGNRHSASCARRISNARTSAQEGSFRGKFHLATRRDTKRILRQKGCREGFPRDRRRCRPISATRRGSRIGCAASPVTSCCRKRSRDSTRTTTHSLSLTEPRAIPPTGHSRISRG